jgi:cell division protein FtsW
MKRTKTKSVDPILLGLVIFLVLTGFLIFSSASLGLLARSGASFSSVALSQLLFGVIGGGVALFILANIHYRHWRKYAFYIFIITLIATTLVFIPGLGMTHGGATRWIDLGFTTVQPSEFLKLGFVIYIATWLSGVSDQIKDWRYGIAPFIGFIGLVGSVMLLQPDTDTFLIMATAGLAMYFTAGAPWRDIILIAIAGVIAVAILAVARPYILDRIMTFMDPTSDPRGSGYQINQSLIAVGSGGMVGRGYGQSIQKFEYLPEPIGDSIFAVFAEEFGFFGTTSLVALFVFLALRGYRNATHAPDLFGTLLIVGIITLIVMQAFLNIAAMVGLAPLSGLPLPFISHGGTALLALLASLGVVLNVSKFRTNRPRA